ncbi:hypothetical protein [Chitinophaga sp. MM2321]|uniref:hypothetical protein n=1 Tax=Chitinophaga sp. MM2321 TaxID=3137178 RepID=UPI0032D586D5
MKKYWTRTLLLLLLCLPSGVIAQDDSTSEATMPAYEMRTVSNSMVEQLKKDKRLQYADVEEKKDKPRDYSAFERFLEAMFRYGAALRGIVVVLLLGGLGYLLYAFMKNNGMSIFRKPPLIAGLEEIQEETLYSAAAYEDKIKTAIQEGDIRQTIRWWYLYTLFQLANRQLITPGREKTNNDYLRSMRNTSYYKTFATLTLDYEYIWYGGFEVSNENFKEMNQQFRDFNNLLGKVA